MVEFGDYQCPYCRNAEPFVERIVDARSDKLRFCFKQFPVRSHERAVFAGLAALAAAAQDKFWEMHRALFAASDLSDSGLEAVARSVALDLERFRAAVADESLVEEIEADKLEGQELGVDRTPTFFVNGKRYYGPLTEVELPIGSTRSSRSVSGSPSRELLERLCRIEIRLQLVRQVVLGLPRQRSRGPAAERGDVPETVSRPSIRPQVATETLPCRGPLTDSPCLFCRYCRGLSRARASSFGHGETDRSGHPWFAPP